MALVYNSNLISQQALRSLAGTVRSTGEVFERLSSGQRINRASDDAAGLAVASGLASRSRVYTQALRNGNDTISLLNIAQGATEDLSGIVGRLKELATQAANGTFTLTQRRSLNTESYALTNEYNRLINSTRFNNLNILTANSGQVVTQLGYGTTETISATSADELRRAIGTGAFGSAVAVGINATTDSSVADFNGDGFLDVAAITALGTSVLVALGNGDGTFKAGATTVVGTGGTVTRLAAGDFDGDGKTDLAIGDSIGHVLTYKSVGGSGTLTGMSDTNFAIGQVLYLSAGDFNSDGKADLAVGRNAATILAAVGTGSGGFNVSSTLTATVTLGNTGQLQLGDFNGDGITDIIASPAAAGTGTVFAGTGDGTFSQKGNFTVAVGGSTITVADFNRDGFDDIMTSDGKLSTSNGDGTFVISSPANFTSGMLKSADVNGDGFIDVVRLSAGLISTQLGNGDGTFAAETNTLAGTGTSGTLADFNSDGVLDVGLGVSGNFNVYLAGTSQITTMQHLDLLDQGSARGALTLLESAFDRISKNLGALGASMSRINSGLQTLASTRDNYESARSRIVDTDVASDAALLVRNQVRQSATTAILAQANQQPALALQLLGGL